MLFPPAAECAGLGAYVAERQPRTSRVTLQSRQQFANQSQSPAAAVSRPDLGSSPSMPPATNPR